MTNTACTWRPRSKSFDDVAVRGGVTVCDFIVIWSKQWIQFWFGSNPPTEVDWLNAHSIHIAPNQIQVQTQPMCVEYTWNLVLVSSVKGPLQCIDYHDDMHTWHCPQGTYMYVCMQSNLLLSLVTTSKFETHHAKDCCTECFIFLHCNFNAYAWHRRAQVLYILYCKYNRSDGYPVNNPTQQQQFST